MQGKNFMQEEMESKHYGRSSSIDLQIEYMNKTKHMFKSKWYELCLLFIIVVSIFLRFYNYDQRLGLAYDQAHDAIVSLYALEQGKLPLLGPFSSAGAFQTGGEWYWFIMAGQSVFP